MKRYLFLCYFIALSLEATKRASVKASNPDEALSGQDYALPIDEAYKNQINNLIHEREFFIREKELFHAAYVSLNFKNRLLSRLKGYFGTFTSLEYFRLKEKLADEEATKRAALIHLYAPEHNRQKIYNQHTIRNFVRIDATAVNIFKYGPDLNQQLLSLKFFFERYISDGVPDWSNDEKREFQEIIKKLEQHQQWNTSLEDIVGFAKNINKKHPSEIRNFFSKLEGEQSAFAREIRILDAYFYISYRRSKLMSPKDFSLLNFDKTKKLYWH